MAEFINFTVKLDSEKDAELIAWLQSVENRSYAIKAALYAYLEKPCPPPVDAPAVSVPLDFDKLTAAIVQGISQGNANLADALERAVRDGLQGAVIVPTGDSVEPRIDDDGQPIIDHPGLLDEMLAGLDSLPQ